ncbi:MAG: ankyrin repeat domain-containing protein [Bauldia sp.]
MAKVFVSGILATMLLLLVAASDMGTVVAAESGQTRLQSMNAGVIDVTGIDRAALDLASIGTVVATVSPGLFPRYGKEQPIQTFPLHAAALNDDVPAAIRLIVGGVAVDVRDHEGRTPLMVAAAFGNANVAATLLAEGADPRAHDRAYGDTPLHFAALAGRIEVVQLLIAQGARVDIGANLGETPLHYAALYNHGKMIAFLVENGASINATDGMGLTPLQYAGRRGRTQAVAVLRELGARPDTLFDAVSAGDLRRVRELLRGHADPNQSDGSQSALHMAAARGYIAIADVLIDAGADIEAEGEPSRGHPLHTAVMNDRPAIAAFLLDRGAQVDARDGQGRTPLIVAAEFGGGVDIGEGLLSRGADPAAIDRTWGDNVLHYAASVGNVTLAKLLVAHGVDVNARNANNGASALHYAACMGKLDMIALLVASGAQLSPVDRSGKTPYERAGGSAAQKSMALLVALGAPK